MYLLEMLYGTSCNNHYRSSYAFLLLLFLRRPGNNQVQSGSVLKHYPGDTEILCVVTRASNEGSRGFKTYVQKRPLLGPSPC